MNNNIKRDDKWKGRFYVKQYDRIFRKYEDGSGFSVRYFIEFLDRETGAAATAIIHSSVFADWELFKYMNDFVIRVVDGLPGHCPLLDWLTLDI